jgi:hypothetical protein
VFGTMSKERDDSRSIGFDTYDVQRVFLAAES